MKTTAFARNHLSPAMMTVAESIFKTVPFIKNKRAHGLLLLAAGYVVLASQEIKKQT